MNGKQDLRVDERLQEVESMLEEYERSLGIDLQFQSDDETPLNLPISIPKESIGPKPISR